MLCQIRASKNRFVHAKACTCLSVRPNLKQERKRCSYSIAHLTYLNVSFWEKALLREFWDRSLFFSLLSFYRCCTSLFSIALVLRVLRWAVPVLMSTARLQVSRSRLKSPGWSWTWPETEMGAQRSLLGWNLSLGSVLSVTPKAWHRFLKYLKALKGPLHLSANEISM